MKKILFLVAVLLSGVIVLTGPLVSASPFDNAKEDACKGAALDGTSSCDQLASGNKDPNATVKLALKLFAAIVGIIAVVMIMVGGLRYMMSGGDAGKAASAQNTVLYAAVGLVVALMAQLIAQFVLVKFSK